MSELKVGQYQWRIIRGRTSDMYTVEKRRYSCTKNGRIKRLFGAPEFNYDFIYCGTESEYVPMTEAMLRQYRHPDIHRRTKTFASITAAQKWIDERIAEQNKDNSYKGDWQP